MGGDQWSVTEDIVLLYFNSRGVQHEACAALIQQKCSTARDMLGVRSRLRLHHKDRQFIWDTTAQRWNLDALDQWLLDQNAWNLQSLLSFNQEDADIVFKV